MVFPCSWTMPKASAVGILIKNIKSEHVICLKCSLADEYGNNKHWIFFCEDDTVINLEGLVQVLNKHDARKVRWKTMPVMENAAMKRNFYFKQNLSNFTALFFQFSAKIIRPSLVHQALRTVSTKSFTLCSYQKK